MKIGPDLKGPITKYRSPNVHCWGSLFSDLEYYEYIYISTCVRKDLLDMVSKFIQFY